MELALALMHVAGYLAGAIATVLAPVRRWAMGLLGVAALLGIALALASPDRRELKCTHTFAGYEGVELEPSPVHFVTATSTADGRLWPLPFLALALCWIGVFRWQRPEAAGAKVYVWPLLFGWSATAAWLGMQALAAPAAVVQPFGLERILWPAGLGLTLALARVNSRFLPMLMQLSLGIVALRLPAAVFSKFASDRQLGTGLDISQVLEIVHPLRRLQFDPPLTSGSGEQQFWLIWAEHVFVYPAFHFMSLAGIAFAALMMRRNSAAAP